MTIEPQITNDCAAFVRMFAEAWDKPTPDKLCGALCDDVRLVQPAAPPIVGRDKAHKSFIALLRWLPDLRGEVDRWCGEDDILFIEFRLMATIGGQFIEWPVIDRFILRDGLAAERVSYFDPTPLITATLRHPSAWWGYYRTRRVR